MSKSQSSKQAKRTARARKNAEIAAGVKNSGKSKYASKQADRSKNVNSPFCERGNA